MSVETASRGEIERRLKTRARAMEQARLQRDMAIRIASRAGFSYSEIGQLVGLTKQRIEQIVNQPRV